MSDGDGSRRIILEKSRTVRRRYQRSDKRFRFTASQIRRIEREEEKEKQAKRLREKERKRIENKKKRAEKEARDREERRRLGLPDPNTGPVSSSQALLSKFIQYKQPSPKETTKSDDRSEDDDEFDCFLAEVLDSGSHEDADVVIEDHDNSSDDGFLGCSAFNGDIGDGDHAGEDDEFLGCSVFCDEEILKQADALAGNHQETTKELPTCEKMGHEPEAIQGTSDIAATYSSSFQDETAMLLEQIRCSNPDEFDTDEDFEQELLKLGATIGT